MKDVCTVNDLLRPMMGRPSVRRPYCAVCGRAGVPLNQHHVVRRGAGRLVAGGVEAEKPTVTLCGSGNASGCVTRMCDLTRATPRDLLNIATFPQDYAAPPGKAQFVAGMSVPPSMMANVAHEIKRQWLEA